MKFAILALLSVASAVKLHNKQDGESVEDLFAAVDADGDGEVTVDEVKNMILESAPTDVSADEMAMVEEMAT